LALNIRSSINQRDRLILVNAKLQFFILKIIEHVSEQFASLRRLFHDFTKLRIHSAYKIYYKSDLIEQSKRAPQKCDTFNM